MNASYHGSRLVHDSRRDIVWAALWRYYFRHRIRANDTVLDLGCGYGEFINHVVARRRIALDVWPDFPKYMAAGVEAVVASVTDLSGIEDGSIDYAFASNLFEHLTKEDFAGVLASLRQKLAKGGRLTVLQPNYRYATSEYFDDFTHTSIWSHIGLANFLSTNDYEVFEMWPRFLPLTVMSRLPVYPALIGLYLMSPFKPLGKQMLLAARPT